MVDKYSVEIFDYLKVAIQDSNAEVRRRARMVFIKYASVYRKLAHKLILVSVPMSYQKAIYDDFISFGIDPEKTMLFNGAEFEEEGDEQSGFDVVQLAYDEGNTSYSMSLNSS
jgi:hypothetical protein